MLPNNDKKVLPRNGQMKFNKQTTFQYAQYYASRGWRVLPLAPAFQGEKRSGKLPSSRGSKFKLDENGERIPRLDKYGKVVKNSYGKTQYVYEYGGCKYATTEVDLLKERFCDQSYVPETSCEHLNIGIATGIESDCVILDMDGKDSFEQLKKLEAIHGKLPDTLRSVTGRKDGEHRIYRPPRDENGNPVEVPSKSGYIAPCIDVKGDGGYIAVEPSKHWTGNHYHFDQDPDNTEIAELPIWVVDLLNGPKWSQQENCLFPEEKKKLEEEKEKKGKSKNKGKSKKKRSNSYKFRHDNTATHKFYICRDGHDEIETIECDLTSNRYYGDCPWHNSVSGRSLCIYFEENRFYCFGCSEKGVVISQDDVDDLNDKSTDHIQELLVQQWKAKQKKYPLTDSGNAERFADEYSDRIRYNWDSKKWLTYDGMRWNAQEGEATAHNYALAIARSIYQEAIKKSEPDEKKKYFSWALKSESAFGISNMLKLARALPSISTYAKNLNQDIYLLNCNDGTIDLRTGKLQEHNPADMITELAPVDFDLDATCSRWEDCLDTWMDGNQEKIRYLQQLMGMCLTGDNTSRVFPVFYGEGMNGKSKFIDTISEIMGDYADEAPENFLVVTRNEKKNEIAELKDKRLVIASETKKNVKLASNLIKSITGDSRIKGRLLYQQSIAFKITYKCVLVTNHLPKVENDKAIWDRIHKVGWNVRIPPEKRDYYLLEKLREEHAGILQWLVKGCLQWLKDGKLIPPHSIIESTNEYKQQSNPLKDFLEECCEIYPEAKIKTSDLYSAYTEWCGKYSLSKRHFNEHMKENGFTEGRTTKDKKTMRYWSGITITEECATKCRFFYENLNKNSEESEEDEFFE